MEIQTASVYPSGSLPRLRVIRQTPSPINRPASEPDSSVAQGPSNLKPSSRYPDSQPTSEDESGTVEYAGGSRLLSASLPPPDSSLHSNDTTHRLRALLDRFDTPPRPATTVPRVVMPPSPSEPESDFDLGPVQAARASIKDLFRNALREPGDTPKKPRLTRSVSFNAMGSPKVNKSRRKSTSDEEKEILPRSPSSGTNGSVINKREDDRGRRHTSSTLIMSDEEDNPGLTSLNFQSHSRSSVFGSKAGIRSKSPALSAQSSSIRYPRPNSPLSRSINETRPNQETGVDLNMSWNSPTSSPSHEQESATSSPSPTPSRPFPRTSNQDSRERGERAPSNPSHNASDINSESTSHSEHPPSIPFERRKRHRRTTTELSEAMGPFPRQNGLSPSLISPNESNQSFFADESVPPPRMSTPTFKSVHLPDLTLSPVPSDVPLPPSPVDTKGDATARADTDLARLQRAFAPNFSFPTRPSPPPLPNTAPPVPPLTTPSRQPSSTNASRPQSKPPSPPVGLPDTPPFEVDFVKTPLKLHGEGINSASSAKTPRFPGAFGTPAPSSALSPIFSPSSSRRHSEPNNNSAAEIEATPKPEDPDVLQTLNIQGSSFASMPLTPAPPGAYRGIPMSSKRKGILKVRFDGDIQTAEDLVEPSAGTVSTANGISSKTHGPSPPPSPSSEDVPPVSLSLSRRKGLRLVDEYGRARRFTEDGEEIILDTRRKLVGAPETPELSVVDDVMMTPRRRAKMRQMDSFGNEVTNGIGSKLKEEPTEDNPKPKRNKAVFSQLAKSLGDLQNDLAQEENALTASFPQTGQRDDERLLDLDMVSKSARIERSKLARKLQLERHAVGGIANETYLARNPTRHMPLETSERASWWKRKWKLVMMILILEMTLLFMGYRLAMVHAKHVWLKTHFDPFFPALYLHRSRPSFLSRFGSLPMDWSAFAISNVVRRVGFRGFLVGVSSRFWEAIWNWGSEPWESWGSPAAGPPVPRIWPS